MIEEKKDQVHTALGLNIIYGALYHSFTSILCAPCGLHANEKAGLSADINQELDIDGKLREKRLFNNAFKDPVCYMRSLPGCAGVYAQIKL